MSTPSLPPVSGSSQPETVSDLSRFEEEPLTHKEAAKVYAGSLLIDALSAVTPDKAMALGALGLVVPVIGPALAPAGAAPGEAVHHHPDPVRYHGTIKLSCFLTQVDDLD